VDSNKNLKIIVSLETKKSLELAERIKDYVDGFKINHLLWDEIVAWPDSWKKELFVDFKLWDTPNTVETVVKKVIDRGGSMVSICAHNCQETFERLKNLSSEIKLVGVASLTSWDYQTERAVLKNPAYNVWLQAMNKLRRYNFQDLICPVPDLRTVKSIDLSGPESFRYICPGIVFEKETSGQTRTGSPKEAKDGGADAIILGRTVTEADNPNEVLVKIKGLL
tara:strand:- start:609 stop:1277 length:669 start_codon:yes stop_codon:yes gene_type:complete